MYKVILPQLMDVCPFCGKTARLVCEPIAMPEILASGKIRQQYRAGCELCGIFFRKESLWEIREGSVECINDGREECVNAWNKRWHR